MASSFEPFFSCSAIQAQSFSSSLVSSAENGMSGTFRSRKMTLRCMLPAFRRGGPLEAGQRRELAGLVVVDHGLEWTSFHALMVVSGPA